MATTIGTITLDGSFTDWLAAQSLMNSANTVAGYQVYGALINDATLGENYVIGIDATDSTNDQTIVAGTIIYLNTDQNDSTGYSPSFASGGLGAEYQIKFLDDSTGALQAYLYSADGTTPLNGGLPLNSGFSTNKESVELAIPQSLLTPTGGTAPTAINFDVLINNATGLPTPFSTSTPQYVIPDPAAAPPPTTVANTITLDGTFTDWPAPDSVMTSGNTVAGYQVYGAFLSNTYVIGIDATNSADPVIGAGSTIYLNTDQNTATGYSPTFASGAVGAEYEVQFSYGPNSELEPFLYSITSAGVTTELNNGQPLPFGMSSNGESVELGIPQPLLTPAGGAAPTSINFAALINNTNGLPSALANNPEYIITDSAALVPVDHTIKKVGIVYSATTAALYFGGGPAGESAYSDLFMDAQHQAEAAGVSYDLLSESDLTDVAKLSQYSALIFPDFQDVQSSQVSAIANALHQVVYEYHVPIITAGDFMTNDQTGTPLPATFANMQDLLNLTSAGFNNSATYSVTPDPTALSNPIMAGYTAGQLIGGASGEFAGTTKGIYTDTGYLTFAGVTQPATTLADINIQATSTAPASTVAGVVQTTTGGTNTDFATTGLFGDSNLLQHVIQNTVFGTTPSLAIDITRFKGIVNSRTDMDQSQFPDDVDPSLNNGKGIYDVLLNEPVSSVNSADLSNLSILAYLNQQYDFVGSYYINIGDNANPANNNTTNWTISTPYYDQLLQMGNEIGDHSYTHLIDPPTTTFPETTTVATLAGSPQVTVNALPSYNGATLGMTVTGTNIGPNTIVTGVSANADGTYTLTLQYLPGGFGTPNLGVTGLVPAGETLTFGVPAENTNFLSTTGTGPFTYNYEFTQSKQIEDANIGIAIAGAAVPGANDYLPDSEQILKDFPTANGLTGYVNGGWTGVGSGSPNAFGYITPSDSESVYIAPDITFDFSEVQFEGKTPESALSDWESLFNQLSSNSETPVIVWPWHDYGITDWPTNGPGTAPPGYNEALYQSFIAYAYNAGDEFVTSEDLASRIAAEQAAKLSETTSGNVITATVTPAASEPDLGAMALNVVNGAAGQVIQNAGSWYAYDSNSVFMPYGGGTFTVTLGTTQDDVTHIDLLPMRADLQSVTGDGSNLTFAMTGDGTVDIHVKTPGTNIISITTTATATDGAVAGAPTATLVGDDLQLVFSDTLGISSTSPQGWPVLHNVTITEGPTAVAGATFVFAAPTVSINSPGGLTNQATQTISGTVTEPTESQVVGTTVSLYDNGSTTALGTATVQAGVTGVDGGLPTWTATVTLSGDGTHRIVASDTDLSKLTGSSSAVIYTLATQPPTVSASESISGLTNKTSDVITVTATAEAVTGDSITGVEIYNGTADLGAATLSGGTWTYTASLLDGQTYNFSAVTMDAAGNKNATPTLAPVTVDTQTPVVAINNMGGATSTPTLLIGGKVTEPVDANVATTTVSLYDNSSTTAFGTAVVGADGSWSTTVTLSLGSNSIVAKDTDLAGNLGASTPVVFTLSEVQNVSVAFFLANRTALDAQAGGFSILDSSSNILSALTGVATDPLNADTQITSIALSDSPSTLTVTVAERLNDKTALGKIVPAPTLVVGDTAAHIQALTAAQIAALAALGVKQIKATDTTVNLATARAQAFETVGTSISPAAGFFVQLFDTSANLQGLTAAQINAAAAIGVTRLVGSNNAALNLNVAATVAVIADHLTVVPFTGTFATVRDSGANIAMLTPSQIGSLAATGFNGGLTSTSGGALSAPQVAAYEKALLKIRGGYNWTLSDTAANLGVLNPTQVAGLKGAGITAISVQDANTVTFTAADFQSLYKNNIALSVQSGGKVVLADTAANIATLNGNQIRGLGPLRVTQINATDTILNFTVNQIQAVPANISLTAANGQVAVSDKASQLEGLTATQIAHYAAIGVNDYVSTNANVTYTASQTSAFLAAHATLSATGTFTTFETFSNQAVVGSASNGAGGGVLTLSSNANGVTVNVGPSALDVTEGSQTIPFAPHVTEAITATGRTKDTFAFTHGFGQDTITGLLAGTSANHDLLQFEASAFGAGLTAANQGADLIALLSGTTNNSAGNAVITDIHGDSLTLNGISKATLSLAANAVDFKFV